MNDLLNVRKSANIAIRNKLASYNLNASEVAKVFSLIDRPEIFGMVRKTLRDHRCNFLIDMQADDVVMFADDNQIDQVKLLKIAMTSQNTTQFRRAIINLYM